MKFKEAEFKTPTTFKMTFDLFVQRCAQTLTKKKRRKNFHFFSYFDIWIEHHHQNKNSSSLLVCTQLYTYSISYLKSLLQNVNLGFFRIEYFNFPKSFSKLVNN